MRLTSSRAALRDLREPLAGAVSVVPGSWVLLALWLRVYALPTPPLRTSPFLTQAV